jgi:tetratricopeptide (TPR) repeat protein
LADDLRRYLMHEPIRAMRSSLVQRARKVARRHPGVTVTAAVAGVVGVLLGMAGLALNNRMVRQEQLQTQEALHRAEQEKTIAQREKAIAQAVRDFLNKLLAQASSRTQADALRREGGNLAAVKPNPTVRELLDRAAAVLTPDKIERQFPGQPLVQAEILKTIGEAYGAISDFGPAISHLERARDLHVRELTLNHPDTLATMESLAKAYLDDRKLPQATTLFERVLDLRSKTLGPDDPQTLASMNNLMRAYFARGRHKEVLKLREDIVRLRKARLGLDHPDTLESMNNLANSYAMVKRYSDAQKLHEETLVHRKALLGADDPDTLASMNNLANCHNALGEHAESLRLHQAALAGRRARLGADHHHTLQSLNNVAAAYAALGRHAEALKSYEETLALRKGKLRPDHPDTLRSLNHVAWLLVNSPDPKLWNPNKALELAKEAVKLAPGNGGYRNTLGAAYYRVGDWKSAVKELTESMRLRKGGDSADWFFLAMAYWRLGDRDQGRMRFDQAVQWMEKNQPHDEELRRIREEAAALVNGEPR